MRTNSIAFRLSSTLFGMVALTSIVGGLGLGRLRDLDRTLEVITRDRFGKLEMARHGLELIEENARLALLVFVGDPAKIDELVAVQKTRSSEITRLYDAFEARIDSEAERAAFADVKAKRRTYVSHRATLETQLKGDHGAAVEAFQREVLPKLVEYIHAWDVLVSLEGERVDEAVAEADTQYAHARLLTIALIAAACLLGAVVAVFVTRRITRPLRRAARAAERLEKEAVTEQLPVSSSDEIGTLSRAFNLMSEAVRFRHERLKREMDIAQGIQAALLPRSLEVPGLDVAASMRPATEVGGDYYDVLPVGDGCWFGIGDVAGHGLESGMIMLMIQSSVLTLIRRDPDASPAAVISAVNRALHENLSDRLDVRTFATLVLLRYRRDGRLVFAGAHEELVVWRASTRTCELVATPGTWIGARRDVEHAMVDSEITLEHGDVVVLLTDGVIEAMNAAGEQLGPDRVCRLVEDCADQPVDEIRARIAAAVAGWEHETADDASVIVLRRS
jgi:serine phosphatase RsbU (regulator of sigma subunit)